MAHLFTDLANNADERYKSSVRALQAWQVLIGNVFIRQIIRYDELSKIMEYTDNRSLSTILGCVMYFFYQNNLPPLTILVINQEGLPGSGFNTESINDYHQRREDVHNCVWYKIVLPSIGAFQTAFYNR